MIKLIKTLSLVFIFVSVVGMSCWKQGQLDPQAKVQATVVPTPVPTPCKSYDFQLDLNAVFGSENHFLSSDHLGFLCVSKSNPELNSLIYWEYMDQYELGSTGSFNPSIGASTYFYIYPNDINIPENGTRYTGIGRGHPLEYLIRATLNPGDKVDFVQKYIQQDNIAEQQQEYIDFNAGLVPARGDFDTVIPAGEYAGLLTRGDDNGLCMRHQQWKVRDLYINAQRVRNALSADMSITMVITCGYRCPAGNRRVVPAAGIWVPTSNHIKGLAFDWDQGANDETNSYANWQIADYLRNKADQNQIANVLLYDQNETIYSYHRDKEPVRIIPTQYYEEVPEDTYFTHGHVDWGD